MILLTFAYLGEAQSFIKNLALTKVDNSLYKNDFFYLLITGEGETYTLKRLTLFLDSKKSEITQVFNLGIAGSLTKELPLHSVHWVKSIISSTSTQQFETCSGNLRCISCDKRITLVAESNELAKIADIVDREAWANAAVCNNFQLNFSCVKLISDYCDLSTPMDQATLIKNANTMSEKLFTSCQTFLN
ncbi:MAG: hypothetical protein U0T83_01160 [Bacteriovoracaceae bacterium]